jgi:hypothetical protein
MAKIGVRLLRSQDLPCISQVEEVSEPVPTLTGPKNTEGDDEGNQYFDNFVVTPKDSIYRIGGSKKEEKSETHPDWELRKAERKAKIEAK